MSDDLRNKERELATIEVQSEIEGHKASISEKRRLQKEARRYGGRDWKKVFGVVKSLKPDKEVVHDLYGIGLGDLKEEGRLSPRRYR